MRTSLDTRCRLFIADRDAVKSAYRLENSYIYPIAAAIFADRQQPVDVDRLKSCERLLKENTGIFGGFRGLIKLPAISMMAVADDPERLLQNALQAYGFLKEYFWRSQYLPLASLAIAGLTDPVRMEQVAARTRQIYNRMKNEHPFLTSSEDSVFAAMLALSDRKDEQIISETEECYSLLKKEFFSANAVQSLSHVLALGEGSAEAKCRKTVELYDALRENGMRYGKEYELATLGVLALLPVSVDQLTRDMAEVDEFLSGQRGYGLFGLGKRQRLMHAAMIVSGDYIGESTMQTAALSSTLSLIIAQQTATCAAIASANAAAAASSSS